MQLETTPDREDTRLTKWLAESVWALVDQGFFSGANFLINVLLARGLEPSAYGAFAMAFSVFLLLFTIHHGFVAEPTLVFAQTRYRDERSEYLRTLLFGHTLPLMVASGLFAAIAAVLAWGSRGELAQAFAGLAIAAPLLILLTTLRRACYAFLEPRTAGVGGGVYLILLATSAVGLHRAGWLTVFVAYCVLGGSALLVSLGFIWKLGIGNPFRGPWPLAKNVRAAHWDYGKWGLGSGFFQWFPTNLFYILLPGLSDVGLQASGALRAAMNLIMPMIQVNGALGFYLIPTLSRRRAAGARLNLGGFAVLLLAASTAYWLALALLGKPILQLVYGAPYEHVAPLLWILGLVPVASAIISVLRGVILANERPDHMFWASLITAVFTVCVGTPLTARWQLAGACTSMVLALCVHVIVQAWFVSRNHNA